MQGTQRGYWKPASPDRVSVRAEVFYSVTRVPQKLPRVLWVSFPEHPRKGKHQPGRGRKQTPERGISLSFSRLTMQTLGAPTGSSGTEPTPANMLQIGATSRKAR